MGKKQFSRYIKNGVTADGMEDMGKKQFSRYIKNGVTADGMEDMYKKCHAAIRKDPSPKAKAESKVTKKRWNAAKIGLAARKAKVEDQGGVPRPDRGAEG